MNLSSEHTTLAYNERPTIFFVDLSQPDIVFICRLLRNIGMRGCNLGFSYMATAIQLVYMDNSYVNSLTTRLYPEIARLYCTTESAVPSAIYKEINSFWDRNGAANLAAVTGYKLYERPYAGELLDVTAAAHS